MKTENLALSLETLKFLVRHPWCFIYPFVVILCATIAHVASIPPTYECEAVISLGAISEEAWTQQFARRKQNLLAKVLYGESIKGVIGKVWPGLSEEASPARYSYLANALRRPKSGIIIQSDRNDQSLVHVSFGSRSPKLCYQVVQATIDTIKSENKKAIEEAIDASVEFLTRQLSLYQDKIASISAEMLKLSTKLREMALELSPPQRELVHRITAESTMEQRPGERAIEGEATGANALVEVEMKLVEARRNKKLLEMRLEQKDFRAASTALSQDKKEDVFTREIDAKKLEMFKLLSGGYLPEHPIVKKLQEEINDLIEMQKKDIEEQVAAGERELTENEKILAERRMRKSLEDLNFAIEIMEDEKSLLEKYKQAAGEQPAAEAALVGPVAVEAAKLQSLRGEKAIMEYYYNSLRKQLEDTDLKSRAEKSRAGFTIEVVEPPKVPLTPLPTQQGRQFLLGLIIAAGASAAISYAIDLLDKSVWTAVDLREKFKAPVIGIIDRICTPGEFKEAVARRSMIVISMAAVSAVTMIAIVVAVRMLKL